MLLVTAGVASAQVEATIRLTPEARMAMSSLSEERRPTAIRMPKRSDIGSVRTTMFGRVRTSSWPTTEGGSPRRMIISAEPKRKRMSRMKV